MHHARAWFLDTECIVTVGATQGDAACPGFRRLSLSALPSPSPALLFLPGRMVLLRHAAWVTWPVAFSPSITPVFEWMSPLLLRLCPVRYSPIFHPPAQLRRIDGPTKPTSSALHATHCHALSFLTPRRLGERRLLQSGCVSRLQRMCLCACTRTLLRAAPPPAQVVFLSNLNPCLPTF